MSKDKNNQPLPWGLSPDVINPGSIKTISKEKLKAFSTGHMNSIKQKSSIMKKKEELEEKKRQEELEQAQVYQEFVNEFENDAPKAKTFIKGDIINSKSNESSKGSIYNPVGMKKMADMSKKMTPSKQPLDAKPDKPNKRRKDQEKKKSNLELFKEELKHQQMEREERHRLKKLGVIPMSAPDAINSGFEPAPSVRDQLDASHKHDSSYFDDDDPNSTNLYVGSIPMSINEEALCRLFGAFGPLASVKIMWPRNDEERKRDRNCGFVAFMKREDAARAQRELNTHEVEGMSLRVGWGTCVPIPPHPVYIPPHLQGKKELAGLQGKSGLPFNAMPRKTGIRGPLILPPNQHDANELLRECVVYVGIPDDDEQRCLINRMAQFVISEGPLFEAMIMNKEINNPKFSFLFDNKSPEHLYYRWRLYSLLQGETFSRWRIEEFRMFKNGSMWKPPPLPDKIDMKILKKVIAEDTVQKRGQLTNSQRDKLEDMLRGLTVERDLIGDCMHWCLQHADASDEIVECLSESLSILQTPPIVKAARLFLLNDLLYNSCAEVRNASSYRTKFEAKLSEIVKNLRATFEEIKSNTTRERFKSQVTGCFKAWREWNIYNIEFILHLELLFIGGENTTTDEVDGIPLDVDGMPLSKDIVDGVPFNEDVSPQPEDYPEDDLDMFEVKKSSKSPPAIKTKWETSPSTGSKWETSGSSKSGKRDGSLSPNPRDYVDDTEKRRKKREIEVKVAEYIEKLDAGKCTRIKEITTTDQVEIYRFLLNKGRDAKRTIKQIATGKQRLEDIRDEMAGSTSAESGKGLLVTYRSSSSRSPSPTELKRKRESSRKSPKSEKKKKSRH